MFDDQLIAIANFKIPLITSLVMGASMRRPQCRRSKGMCASGRCIPALFRSKTCLIQMRQNSHDVAQHQDHCEFLTTEVTRNRAAKSPTRRGTVPRQRNRRPPQPRGAAQHDRQTWRNETFRRAPRSDPDRASLKSASVGDGLQSSELDSPRLLRPAQRLRLPCPPQSRRKL
jgi:hypothetical protein